MSFCTTVALFSGVNAKSGQAAVVGMPAKSILSLIAKGMPYSGKLAGAWLSNLLA